MCIVCTIRPNSAVIGAVNGILWCLLTNCDTLHSYNSFLVLLFFKSYVIWVLLPEIKLCYASIYNLYFITGYSSHNENH